MPEQTDFRDNRGDGVITAPDGVALYCRWWIASLSRARIFVLHGGLEHCGRLERLCDFLHRQGYSAFAADFRGMGQSGGSRTDITGFALYADDLAHISKNIAAVRGDEPTFVLGYSTGAIVAVQYALRHQANQPHGLILLSTPLCLPARPHPLLERLARYLVRSMPTLRIPIHIKPAQLTSDPTNMRSAKSDPLFERTATLRWALQLLDASDALADQLKTISLPVLVLHGAEDSISDCAAVRKVENMFVDPRSRLAVIPNARHELHNEREPIRQAVYGTLHEWLTDVVAAD